MNNCTEIEFVGESVFDEPTVSIDDMSWWFIDDNDVICEPTQDVAVSFDVEGNPTVEDVDETFGNKPQTTDDTGEGLGYVWTLFMKAVYKKLSWPQDDPEPKEEEPTVILPPAEEAQVGCHITVSPQDDRMRNHQDQTRECDLSLLALELARQETMKFLAWNSIGQEHPKHNELFKELGSAWFETLRLDVTAELRVPVPIVQFIYQLLEEKKVSIDVLEMAPIHSTDELVTKVNNMTKAYDQNMAVEVVKSPFPDLDAENDRNANDHLSTMMFKALSHPA